VSIFTFVQISLDLAVVPVREATFLSGGLWIGLLYKLHLSTQRWASEYVGAGFSGLIWPLALGLFFWMLPLLLNELVHSEDFQEMLHRTPSLQRA